MILDAMGPSCLGFVQLGVIEHAESLSVWLLKLILQFLNLLSVCS